MSDVASLNLDGQSIELPVVVGSEGERGVDVGKLRATTGYVTLDPAYARADSRVNSNRCTAIFEGIESVARVKRRFGLFSRRMKNIRQHREGGANSCKKNGPFNANHFSLLRERSRFFSRVLSNARQNRTRPHRPEHGPRTSRC